MTQATRQIADRQPEPPAPKAAMDANADNAKRRQILGGARMVFRAKGFDGASMEAIAKAAGVSKGTLYVYFDSKETLFEALINEERLDQAELMLKIEACQSDLQTDLRMLGRTYVEAITRPEKLATLRMVVGAAEKFPQFGQILYEAGPCRGVARISEYLKKRVAAGDLKDCDTELAASHFFDLCVARLLRRLLLNVGDLPGTEEINDTVDRGVEVFMAAYAARR
ncbi:TetR/AcrR family transcriptional regulator [Breoghania sp. L-A4]|uniref:TetR/AcrR family transcriptional regulator n=1 Tax=Breoghania sp. L-A4 TaxID=2304600 RepID=UPI000E35B49F|nr:TetR/AcrR family transcriptional regulator [Breoghania sp. L-A4]AXS40666.1 TetR family transcriptional regulator [Breoghania sp. L-A4]